MSVIHNDLLLSADAATGYNLTKSLRLRSSASAYMTRTPGSVGNQQKWTWSSWVKIGALGTDKQLIDVKNGSAGVPRGGFSLASDNTFSLGFNSSGSSWDATLITSQVFRDPSAWYHIIVSVDTTQSTASNRMKLYINGSQVTAFSTAIYPSQNTNLPINNNVLHNIGRADNGISYVDGYISELNFIDGQQLTPTSFGETDSITGVWKPKRYTGTYGTNGFYLPFTDVATTSGSNAGLGKDFSGNGNYWNTNNISVTAGATYDSMKDVPTLTDTDTANYCVLNPLDAGTNLTFANGNLQISSTTNPQNSCRGTLGMSSGKWYWEVVVTSGTPGCVTGIAGSTFSISSNFSGDMYGYDSNGNKIINGTGTSYGSSWAANDVIGVAFDASASSITFYKNNTSQGTISSITSGITWRPFVHANNVTVVANFGQRPFAYTPPTGFKALNTYNLPDSNIVAGNAYFDAKTYTGTSTSSGRSVTGLSFKPDFVWLKSRTDTFRHELFDIVRGVGKNLASNSTDAEDTNNAYGYLSSFDSSGFTSSPGATDNARFNQLNSNFVYWAWKGAGSTSSNTSGSITSTVSVNANAGFSIVTYSGVDSPSTNTVGHGLGVAPSVWIIKNRSGGSGAYNWVFNYVLNGVVYYMFMNNTQVANAQGSPWSTLPTSSVITLGANDTNTCNAGDNYVAYCWTPIDGYSSFGSYIGNGSSDGAFVYTGFRPKYVMIKCTQTADYGHWAIKDTSRSPSNVASQQVYANFAYGEDNEVTEYTDILSNGFKLRGNLDGVNGSGKTYIYMAFAENPFKNSLAR